MSFDRRIRDELERTGERIEVDVDRNLGAVEARARMRQRPSAAFLVLAAAVVVALVLSRMTPASGPGVAPGPTPSATPPAAAATAPGGPGGFETRVAGTWSVSLPSSNATVTRDGVAGVWTLRLQPDGVALLSAPASFDPGSGALTGISFSVGADTFRTDLFYNDFCTSIGTYAWATGSGRLTLTPITDDCSKRRTLLATAPWVQAP